LPCTSRLAIPRACRGLPEAHKRGCAPSARVRDEMRPKERQYQPGRPIRCSVLVNRHMDGSIPQTPDVALRRVPHVVRRTVPCIACHASPPFFARCLAPREPSYSLSCVACCAGVCVETAGLLATWRTIIFDRLRRRRNGHPFLRKTREG
jgi:hypothetical protein